jgi:hypothetical protein
MAQIERRRSVLFLCKKREHRSFDGVYYIPRLTANIMSVGQLDEMGYDVHIKGRVMSIHEPSGRQLAKIGHAKNRLYLLQVNITQPVCLAVRGEEIAWRWHARFGHIGMAALRRMAQEELVRGLPAIEEVDRLCEACFAGKQKRSLFPDQVQWRAEQPLELVHGDWCGPISPETPSGSSYFLLLVDDRSRFMWISTLVSKGQASTAIMEF